MGKETVINSVKDAFLNVQRVIDADSKVVDVFCNVKHVLKFVNMITDNLNASKMELRATCSFLSTLLQEEQFSLNRITKLTEQRTAYSQIDDTISSIWSTAVSHEKSLIHSNRYLTNMDKGTSSDVINALQDTISEKDIVKFLSTLQSKAIELIRKSEVESAQLACAYINLYMKIEILHSFVLWQLFCIKLRCAYDQSSTKGVLSMIESSKISSLDMVKYITHPDINNAVFLSVFHLTQNEKVLDFLQIQGIEPLVFDERFYDHKHYIERISPPCVRLQMVPLLCHIYGTETTERCEFIFESVDGRKWDNVCYIRSAHWENYYIQMNGKGLCVAVEGKPESGGKWKCISLEPYEEHPRFIISPIDSPDLFLYLNTGHARSRKDIDKVKEKGIWKICGPA